jgi:hypothetical protein
MRRIVHVAAACATVLSLMGVLAGVASGEATLPTILPEGTAKEPLTGTSKSGKSTFGPGAFKIESSNSTGSFSGNSKKLGTYDLLYLAFQLEGVTCTGLKDTVAGSVLAPGAFHIRHYNLNGKLFTAEIFLFTEFHFECGELLFTVKGCVAGELTPNEEKLVEKLTVALRSNGKGDNEVVKVLNEASTGEENCEFLAKIGAGAFVLSTLVQTMEVEGFKKGGKAVTVLVMPL